MATKDIMTPVFRVSFPEVFKAKAAEEGGEPKFSISMLFEKGEDLSRMQNLLLEAAKEKWGDDVNVKSLRRPFRDQGEKEISGYVDGAYFASASSKQKPAVVDEDVEPILDQNDFYAGCYAQAKVHAYAWDNKYGKGVSFGLGNIQKVRDGERLGGRAQSDPKEDFAPVQTQDADAMADMMG